MDDLYTPNGIVDKNRLWQQHISLVRHEALRLCAKLPASVELDDLLQVGGIGLLNAINGYNASLGVEFSTYAVQRIRGSMLDELRNRDWLPRAIRQEIKKVTKAISHLQQKLSREPEDSEIAQYLSLSLTEYQRILLDSNSSQLFSLDEMVDEFGDSGEAQIQHNKKENPLELMLGQEMRQAVVTAIELLPEKEKMIIALYYQENLNLKEIGAVLEVSESRISQLHSQAIKRIKGRLLQYNQPEDK